jgi:lipopolysaccharide export system protein LptC
MDVGRAMAQGGLMSADRPGAYEGRAGESRVDEGRLGRSEPGRARAFQSAARHSARVKWLRRLIVGGAALTSIGVVGFSWLRSATIGDSHFSIESIGISGDKVTMAHPKMTGVRQDGRPYEVTADSGVQNPRDPSRTKLTRLDAHLHLQDDGETRVLGDEGLYDAQAQTLDLTGHVRIKGVAFDLAMQSAQMNFKTSALSSNQPVRLDFKGGWVSSDKMSMAQNAEQITFLGNVQSEFRQADDDGLAQAARKDN